MENIDKEVDDGGVKDFTENMFEDEETAQIRLSTGFSLQELAAEDGIIFEPEFDEAGGGVNQEELNRNYFTNDVEEISGMMSSRNINEDSDTENDDDTPEFERIQRKMTPVTEDRGVMKRVLASGLECHGKVPPGATVTIDYSMLLEAQDEPFDSSTLRGRPERYKLGEGRLIAGLELAIQSMKKKEKSQFLIDHQYAFGHMGCPPRVPSEAVILCLVEVIDFVEEGVAEALLAMPAEERCKAKTYEEIVKAVRLEHVNGNNYVHKEEWQMALRHYERGIRLILDVNLKDEEQEKERNRLLLKLNLNKAHCCLKILWPKKACIACREALDVDPNNTKAYFRRHSMVEGMDPIQNANLTLNLSADERSGKVREVGGQATWSLSSCKPGFGVDQLRDDCVDTYWQSDGQLPHLVNIQFRRKTTIQDVSIYTDYKLDESYTPTRISVRVGTNFNDLQEIEVKDLQEPSGWIVIPLRDLNEKLVRTFMVQIAVIQNHQQGRDTHMRQIKVHSPVQNKIVSAAEFTEFSTSDLKQFAFLR